MVPTWRKENTTEVAMPASDADARLWLLINDGRGLCCSRNGDKIPIHHHSFFATAAAHAVETAWPCQTRDVAAQQLAALVLWVTAVAVEGAALGSRHPERLATPAALARFAASFCAARVVALRSTAYPTARRNISSHGCGNNSVNNTRACKVRWQRQRWCWWWWWQQLLLR